MSLVKRGQTSTRINSASGIQSHTTVGGDATGGLLWGNLGNLGALGGESCRAAALRDTPNTMACHPRVKGERKKAHRLNTEIVFLPQNSCKRVRRLAAERNRDAAEHRVIWNSIPPDPVCTIQEKTNPVQKQRTGAAKKSQPRKIWCIQILCNTCCLATVLVGLTSKYKKAMWYEFQKWTENGELCNRYTTWEELTSEIKGKTPLLLLLPRPYPPILSPFTWSSRLDIFQIHFLFNPHISYTSVSMLLHNLSLEW